MRRMGARSRFPAVPREPGRYLIVGVREAAEENDTCPYGDEATPGRVQYPLPSEPVSAWRREGVAKRMGATSRFGSYTLPYRRNFARPLGGLLGAVEDACEVVGAVLADDGLLEDADACAVAHGGLTNGLDVNHGRVQGVDL